MKQNKVKDSRPWFDQYGNELTDIELKKVSKSWSPSEWDSYLKSIETPLQEVLLPNFDKVATRHKVGESLREHDFDEKSEEPFRILSPSVVRKALRELTYKQRTIIELCIFDDLSVVEASKIIGITPKAASKILARATECLKSNLDPKILSKHQPSRNLRKTEMGL